MMRALYLTAMCLCWGLLAGCSDSKPSIGLEAMGQASRASVSLNDAWHFRRGQGKPLSNLEALDESWSAISIPHTWNAEDGADGGDDYFRGDGWYHRELKLEDNLQGKRFYLQFNGANLITDVFIDGQAIGQHAGGYAAFRFDVTDHLTLGGRNLLSVKVNNARHEDVPPLAADFTFFGGLYRDVELLITQAQHFDVLDYASKGVYVNQRAISAERADINVRSRVINAAKQAQSLNLKMQLLDAIGKTVINKQLSLELAAGATTTISESLSLADPHLWQGVTDPYLYQLRLTLSNDAGVVDTIEQPLGLRDFKVDPVRGAFLNGKPVRLQGVSRHQDKQDKGWALSRADHEEDFQLILEMGANAVRLAHYQHDEYVYQLADRLGLLIWAEVPVISEVNGSQAFTDNTKQQLIELIRQNYNHASIVMWGLFNEISIHGTDVNTALVTELQALAKSEDQYRLTTGAVLGDHEAQGVFMLPDIVAQNRYDGWYYNDFDGMGEWLDRSAKAFPSRALGISEYGAGASTDIHSDKPVNQDHTEEYQNLYHEENWLIMRERPFMWGSFIWNMFDFAADLRDEGSVPGLNNKGMVNHDRSVKKDSFFWYQSHWRKEPMLYITSRRFDLRKTPEVSVKVYSNLEAAELFLGGQSQGVQRNDGSNRLRWPNLPLSMGNNKIEVRGVGVHRTLSDQVTWVRVLNDDTRLASTALGIDNLQSKIYNPPYGFTQTELRKALALPYGAAATFDKVQSNEAAVKPGDTLTITAASGAQQVFTLAVGPLSIGRPVKANRELKHGMMGSPPAQASNAVNGNAELEPAEGKEEFWITADPMQGPGWLKIDLGRDYFIDRLDSAWLPVSMGEQGTMQYTIDVAKQKLESAVVFAETYHEAVDQRSNSQALRTTDAIGQIGRHVRINILDSSYAFDVPVLGRFKLIGATEFSVHGGLLYSDRLTINYQQRTIAVASGFRVEQVRELLNAVPQNAQWQFYLNDKPLKPQDTLLAGSYLLLAANDDAQRRERYDFELQ